MSDFPDNGARPASAEVTTARDWSIGIAAGTAQAASASVAGLTAAGLQDLRLFVQAGTIVPAGCAFVPVTLLDGQLSPPAVTRLIVAELLMRSGSTDLFLLLEPAAPAGNIAQWCRRAGEHLISGRPESLVVDSSSSPGRYAFTAESAQAFLAGEDGLAGTLQDGGNRLRSGSAGQSLTEQPIGAALTEWADRTSRPIVEIAIAEADAPSMVLPDSLTGHDGAITADQPLRISGASVSVVVPTWNCADYLAACLRSLQRQTVDAEIIVVDDASTDGTAGVLDSLADRITVVRHRRRRGANAARNTGLAAAGGEFIAFADADNEYAPGWIEQLLQALLADHRSALAYCGYSKQFPDGSLVTNPGAAWDVETLWSGNYIDMSSIVRRSALPAEGLHEGFRPFDDWRLWLALARRGWEGTWVPDELFVKHVRDAGKTEQSQADPHLRCADVATIRRQFAGLVGFDRPVSVVIPASGCEDLTTCCLDHLSRYCGVPFEVVYVDNGSPLPTLDAVAGAAEDAGIVLRMIRNRSNLGFTPAVNQGIAASAGADVLLLNNDCFIGPGCVESLVREIRSGDRVAAAGPLTGDEGRQSLKQEELRSLLPVPEEVLDELDDPVRVSLQLSQKLRSIPRQVLSFYCALLSGEALSRLGPLDERFSAGLAADDEWCLRAGARGREVRLVLSAYAAHLHQSSFRRLHLDRDALQADAKRLLHQVLADEGQEKSAAGR